jgi:cell wall-associated NlpC family hydrolase
MSGYDPRITPGRPDLAAEHLRGKVSAARYVPGVLREITVSQTGLLRAPKPDSPVETELLFGERFTVYDANETYAWGQAELDGYVGYVRAHALGNPGAAATHRVAVRQSRLYAEPSGKARSGVPLSLGARLRVERDLGRFVEVSLLEGKSAFVPASHMKPIGERVSDFVSVAEQLVGVPYLWGGRTSFGLDCSALVQLALAEAGTTSPRDSDRQREALGEIVGGEGALSRLERGDLIFWKNHVAIAVDRVRIIHANALAMAVSIETATPFARAVEGSEGPVITVKRLK